MFSPSQLAGDTPHTVRCNTAKTQSGWQSRVHFGQKINLTISLFFMDGLQVQYLFITSLKYLGAFASGFRDMP